ncbi:TIGR03960 family B12-binding radical SAM protein [Cutibacterium equinum]|uniref:TIGR03960 family B12-binding radical SAM protein n=1 Tax=Cutibacterium equinum TaxID=3016342 RepID=A0ABY7QZZ0_9ACTN|nr:TIGR03960 family B12-binding radical SAM protein [Cutibacterium equinum]WCC80618.1 TIGR03960 family B12-binding radical SAM protein [Cutibacterium equinum]
MSTKDLFDQIEPLLYRVTKPIRYVGGERNSIVKEWQDTDVRWVLMYPDVYEVGQPNQGVAVLYEVLNERDWIMAERTYSVWPDMEQQMRAAGVPQFTLDGHRPVRDFDVLSVSLSTELGYTNMLNAIDLAGIPVHQADRGDNDPIVLIGGHVAFNPEPVADFIDAAVLGDGEEACLEISQVIRDWKREGRPGGREGVLVRLAQTGGVYVPSFYDVEYLEDATIGRIAPNRPEAPVTVAKRIVMNLDEWQYPKRPIVPVAETFQQRYPVEISRGCTHPGRFCQASMVTRPLRERSINAIAQMVHDGLQATGLDHVALMGLSGAGHSEVSEITKGLGDRYEGTNVSLSLPSTFVGALSIDAANELSRDGRRSGLTFAPEGGSERIRRVINKYVSDEELVGTVAKACGDGWHEIELYFMCGLPTETDEDVLEIHHTVSGIIEAGRAAAGREDIHCTIYIGGFVPKPHTPFQWAAQASADEVDHRLSVLQESIGSDGQLAGSTDMFYRNGRPGVIEGLLSRGDRRVGKVVEAVWRDGGIFDGWDEYFSYDRWVACCQRELEPLGVSLDWFVTRERDREEVLPWEHLDSGLDRDWLWNDWQAALNEETVSDCLRGPCYNCGVCPSMGTEIQVGPSGKSLIPLTPIKPDLAAVMES